MQCEPTIVKLKDLCIGGKGKYGIPASAVPYSENLYTYLRITDITDDGRINKSGLVSVDDEKAGEYVLQPNDIVFARTGGSTGRNYFYDGTDGEFVYAGFLIKFSIDPNCVNPKYVKYYCQSKQYRDWVNSFNTGSTRGNINAQTYANMELSVPCRKQQDLLVDTLSALDEKIELNNKINENLQQQALCLYSDLTKEQSKNGYIGDYCTIKSGYAFKSKWWQDSGVPVVKIGSINQDYLNLLGCSFVSEDKIQLAKDYTVTGGDILIAMTGATIGKFALVPKINQPVLVNQRVGKFFLGGNPVNKVPFMYCTLKQPEIIREIINRGQGSAQPNISTSDIMTIPCILPPREDINRFNREIAPMFELIINNQSENILLAKAKELLLPKVLSGEIEVEGVNI